MIRAGQKEQRRQRIHETCTSQSPRQRRDAEHTERDDSSRARVYEAFRTWRRNYDSFINVCSLSMVAMSCWLKAEASTTNNSPILRYYPILLVGHLSCVTKISPV